MSDLTLHPHEQARLRELRPEDELLVVRPVEPQPHLLKDAAGRPMWRRGELYWRGDRSELLVWYSPHRPGDVVEVQIESGVCHCGESVDRPHDHNAVDMPYTYRLRLARVEARRVRGITEEEWAAAGIVSRNYRYPPYSTDVIRAAKRLWNHTYAPIDPQFVWDRAWGWCEWWQTAAQQGEEG